MVSLVSIVRKQSYWILARFMRALIVTIDDREDVSVATRQEVFLLSSKMDLLPGFLEPNGGYPKSVNEWMSLSPVFHSGMKTGEILAFMRCYNYKTEETIAEECRLREKEAAAAALVSLRSNGP